jgi:L-cystine transport system permease protein
MVWKRKGYYSVELSFDAFAYYFPKLLKALPVTLTLVAFGAVIGIVVGIVFAFVRLERIPVLNQLALVLISFFRGTPILIQMFVVYFALPGIASLFDINILSWDKIIYLYITFGLNTGAFLAEAFRSAILAVPKLQNDAAAAIGFSKVQTYFRIIIPQAVIIAIPTMGTTIVSLLQESALAFAFGVIDVIGTVQQASRSYGHTIEGYLDAAAIFIVLAILLENVFGYIERKATYQSPLERQGA